MARVRLTREAREKLIVEGAIRFFAEVGFGGQTRELSRQLRMSQSLLFKYFPTKSDLIDRVYEEVYLSRWNPYWEVLLENDKLPLRQRLLKFYSEYARRIMDYHWIRIFLYAGLLGSEINKNYLELLKSRIIYQDLPRSSTTRRASPDLADHELTRTRSPARLGPPREHPLSRHPETRLSESLRRGDRRHHRGSRRRIPQWSAFGNRAGGRSVQPPQEANA